MKDKKIKKDYFGLFLVSVLVLGLFIVGVIFNFLSTYLILFRIINEFKKNILKFNPFIKNVEYYKKNINKIAKSNLYSSVILFSTTITYIILYILEQNTQSITNIYIFLVIAYIPFFLYTLIKYGMINKDLSKIENLMKEKEIELIYNNDKTIEEKLNEIQEFINNQNQYNIKSEYIQLIITEFKNKLENNEKLDKVFYYSVKEYENQIINLYK